MKLVIGAPVKERAWVLPEWMWAINNAIAQVAPLEVEVMCLYTESTDNTLQLLESANVTVLYDDRPGRSLQEIEGHCWGLMDTYEYMASIRNRLLQSATLAGADYFFSLDTDIIIPPNALHTLLRHFTLRPTTVVAPAVNMQINGTSWNTMSWVDPAHPAMADRPMTNPPAGPVDVVMAAMMLDTGSMLECEWEAHGQGEDIGFSLNAARYGIELWWDPSIECRHLMYR